MSDPTPQRFMMVTPSGHFAWVEICPGGPDCICLAGGPPPRAPLAGAAGVPALAVVRSSESDSDQ